MTPAKQIPEEASMEVSLRPTCFNDYIGQKPTVDKLRVYVTACRNRGEALDHCLFYGPPGLGKTSLAAIIAKELGTNLILTSGPALEKRGDLAGYLTNLLPGDVLFIDEIHRLSVVAEEYLYPAMEDGRVDVAVDAGRTVRVEVHPFTLVAATTNAGSIPAPLRDRFPIQERLQFYTMADLATIVERSARLLGIRIDREGAEEVARRSRGTPRIANRLLRRLRDFAEVEAGGTISGILADTSLSRLDIDRLGLDHMDRTILSAIIENYEGGPVGLQTLGAAIGEDPETLEEVYEPFLIQLGFLQRTPRGRLVTKKAYKHLNQPLPEE